MYDWNEQVYLGVTLSGTKGAKTLEIQNLDFEKKFITCATDSLNSQSILFLFAGVSTLISFYPWLSFLYYIL